MRSYTLFVKAQSTMMGVASFAMSLYELLRQRWAVCGGRIQIFVNLTVPMRLAYVKDRVRYALACDEEACHHYGERRSHLSLLSLVTKAFLVALFTSRIPSWFVDGWFVQLSAAPTVSVSQASAK